MVMIRIPFVVTLLVVFLSQHSRARQMYSGQLARATFVMPDKSAQWQSNLQPGYSGGSGGQPAYSYGPGETHGASSGYGTSYGDGKGVAHIRFVFGEPSATAGSVSEYGQSNKYDSSRSAVSPFGQNAKYSSPVSEYGQPTGKYGGSTSSAIEYGQPNTKTYGATSAVSEYGQSDNKYGGGASSSAEYAQQNNKYPTSGSLAGNSDYSALSKFANGPSQTFAQQGEKAASFAPESQHVAPISPYGHQGGSGNYETFSPSQLNYAAGAGEQTATNYGPSSGGQFSYAQPVAPQSQLSHSNDASHASHHASTAELHPQESGQPASPNGHGGWWDGWMKGWYDGYKYGGGKGHPLKQ